MEYAKYQKMMQENAAFAFHQSLRGDSAPHHFSPMAMGHPLPFGLSIATPGTPYSASSLIPPNQPLTPTSLQMYQSSQSHDSSTPSQQEIQAILNKSLYQVPQTISQPSQQLLHDILTFQDQQKEKIEHIFQKQKEFVVNPQQVDYNILIAEQGASRDQLLAALSSLAQVCPIPLPSHLFSCTKL